MLDTLIALAVTFGMLAVLVPLGLCYLLARQVAPIRPLRTMLLVIGLTLVAGPIGLLGGLLIAAGLQRRWQAQRAYGAASTAVPAGMGRHWTALLRDAEAARSRYCELVDATPDGPLRDSLHSGMSEVDQAVAEAHRLAEQGDRTERAHRDVMAALNAQWRRRRRAPQLSGELERSLQDATRSQHESAERLAASARRDLAQLQLVVARLHELTAHGLELTTSATGAAALPADLSIADRLSALRLATDEVEQAARL